jgi:nicotinate-nucleotide adenylyltransferase
MSSIQTLAGLQEKVHDTYTAIFGRTPLKQRLDDIMGEAMELHRFTDLRNMREEAGDLLGSLLQLINENGWSAQDLILENLSKIDRRKNQYKSLGRKIKVAILGGAFNPITPGHIEVAQFVLNSSKTFDEVWLLPCANHMYGKKLESPKHRLNMCHLASKIDRRIKVSNFEIINKLSGETYHMVKKFLETDMGKNMVDISLIIGMDNANTFEKWVNYEELERMIRFVVVPRTGESPKRGVNWYRKTPHIFLEPEKPILEISSTVLREAFSDFWTNGNSANPVLLDMRARGFDEILDYVVEHKLYHPRKK